MARERGAVLVTGSSTGIGRATAIELDRAGFRVFAGVRKEADAESLRAEGSDRVNPITLDVAKPVSVSEARRTIEVEVGEDGLAGLVNNAGIGSGGPIEHMPMSEFRKVIDVNLTGSVAVTQALLPLVRRAQGRIVFIASIGGRIAYPFMSPYHASKFGLEGVADSLRREIRPWGVKVIVIEPGLIATPIWEKGNETAVAIRKSLSAEGRRDYGDVLDAFAKVMLETGERGLPPERVAKVVRRSLTKRFPDTRYRVGMDARVAFAVSRVIGDRAFDRVIARMLKTPRKPPG